MVEIPAAEEAHARPMPEPSLEFCLPAHYANRGLQGSRQCQLPARQYKVSTSCMGG